MSYDIALFIGRFQPFHIGHRNVVQKALSLADKVLIMIGSSFQPRAPRNPWFYEEREQMVRALFNAEDNARIICKPLMDIRYNDALWITQVQKAIYEICPNEDAKVTLIGQTREGSGASYFTSLFPQWDSTSVQPSKNVNGAKIRAHLLEGQDASTLTEQVDDRLIPQLSAFMASDIGQDLKKEHDFIQDYKKAWKDAPFEPTYVTVDSVVIQSGHILLVKRNARPGRGLWALPGGFIQPEEKLIDAAIRKLKEKTKIKVPEPVLYGSIKKQDVFDAPFRSERGRTITQGFYIELRDEDSLPKVKSGPNAEKCVWVPLGQLDSSKMFDDHYFIVQKLLGTV